MTGGEVLKRVYQDARRNQFDIRPHAWLRMNQRGIVVADLRAAMMSAKSADWNAEEETWRLTGGTDLDGSELVVCVAVEWTVAVVTVFLE